MMMKMGFKPGQSLGRIEDSEDSLGGAHPAVHHTPEPAATSKQEGDKNDAAESSLSGSRSSHRVQPLPIDVWTGG